MFVTISSRCYFTLTWMAVRFVRRVHSSDYIDHLLIEKSWKGELAYADHYWPYCSDFTVCDFLQSWVCAWKAWFQDAKITAHRPEKTWAVIFNIRRTVIGSTFSIYYTSIFTLLCQFSLQDFFRPMACNGMSFGFLLPLSLPFRIFQEIHW